MKKAFLVLTLTSLMCFGSASVSQAAETWLTGEYVWSEVGDEKLRLYGELDMGERMFLPISVGLHGEGAITALLAKELGDQYSYEGVKFHAGAGIRTFTEESPSTDLVLETGAQHEHFSLVVDLFWDGDVLGDLFTSFAFSKKAGWGVKSEFTHEVDGDANTLLVGPTYTKDKGALWGGWFITDDGIQNLFIALGIHILP